MRMAIRHYEWNMTAAGASAALVLFMLYLFRRKTNLAELINCVTYGVPSKQFSVSRHAGATVPHVYKKRVVSYSMSQVTTHVMPCT